MLVCPYCHREYNALKQHCTKTHHLNWDQVQADYPGLQSSSEERIKKYSDHMRKMNQDPEFNAKKVQRTEKKAIAARKNLAIINNDPIKRQRVNQLASERMSRWNSSDEGRKVRSELMLKYHRENPGAGQKCCFRGKRCKVKLDDHREVQVRSLLEMRIIQNLRNNFDVFIDYEPFGISYIGLDQKEHTYIPDLLIDNKIIFEIKPKSKVLDPTNQLKKDAVLNEGYAFAFITSPEDLFHNDYLVQRLSKV